MKKRKTDLFLHGLGKATLFHTLFQTLIKNDNSDQNDIINEETALKLV